MDDRIVEAVARAIYEDRNGVGCKPWRLQTKAHQTPYLSDARAAITAYQAEAWQPIETAPRDGEIIVITNGRWVEVTYWSVAEEQFPWVTLDPAIGINGRVEDSPTHWQPLPPAPKASP